VLHRANFYSESTNSHKRSNTATSREIYRTGDSQRYHPLGGDASDGAIIGRNVMKRRVHIKFDDQGEQIL